MICRNHRVACYAWHEGSQVRKQKRKRIIMANTQLTTEKGENSMLSEDKQQKLRTYLEDLANT